MTSLKTMTPSRVRLEAEGGPYPLSRLMAFQEDHAAARDAIFRAPDWQSLETDPSMVTQRVKSRAQNRAVYLKRPDLGRRLAQGTHLERTHPALAIVIADGLSPPALSAHAAPLVHGLRAVCQIAKSAPIFLAEQARVAIGDEIGAMTGAELVLVLIGERPGLTVSDSLGAYLSWKPNIGTRDSSRNCVSNIHANGGLSYAVAAARLAWLISRARDIETTGIGLKDNSPELSVIAGRTAL
ncbi:ethanolamine ammonia-lyase subunit EutC [Puniceibacterium antarcticum]|uniref:ethanolamine ammonia-lyase subunit EutC n=1 Tax=Puniceibacterium antarcticum TaxID=1206336 RepID=UPI001FE4FBB5|nr:ethanolamine ammonia-lyase subunit EutC [Puniceibacterium antarcticum]